MPPPDDRQFALFQELPASSPPPHRVTTTSSGRRFKQGDAKAIFLGMMPLEDQFFMDSLLGMSGLILSMTEKDRNYPDERN
jgi:hypothetical protein